MASNLNIATLSNCGNFLRDLTTTFFIEIWRNTLVKSQKHSKIVKYWIIRSQDWYITNKVQRLDGSGLRILGLRYSPSFDENQECYTTLSYMKRGGLKCRTLKLYLKYITSGVLTLQHSSLFGKPLRAYHTKDSLETSIWPSTNLGMVKVDKIGQSACLLPIKIW